MDIKLGTGMKSAKVLLEEARSLLKESKLKKQMF